MDVQQRQPGANGQRVGGGRAGISPLLRHSPVRPPGAGDGGGDGGAPLAPPLDRADQHQTEVYLGNWPPSVHEMEIDTLFRKYGLCARDIRLHRRQTASDKHSYAFVELASSDDVQRAIDQLHGGKVLGHQIIVQRSNRNLRASGDGAHPAAEETAAESWPWAPPEMPALVLPGHRPTITRRVRRYGDGELDAPLPKRSCLVSCDTVGSSGDPAPARRLPVAARSASAVSRRIRMSLHAPLDVVVANFPTGTSELDLMMLFRRFSPVNVRIMVNNSGQHPDHFTYAYVTLSSRMAADEAMMALDGQLYEGRLLVVEAKTCSGTAAAAAAADGR